MCKYYINIGTNKAFGEFLGKQMKVLKDSTISNNKMSSSFKNAAQRESLMAEKTRMINGKRILIEDIVFNSPSAAAVFCTGRSSNGWLEWKNSEGKTLDSTIRR